MSYSGNEVKSGLLITIAFVLLIALTFVVGNHLAGETRDFQVKFAYVAGLEKNAPVYYAGVEVGKVQGIEVVRGEEKPVLLTVGILSDIMLRTDSVAYIDTLGMMGEKFVELTPGTATSDFLAPGAAVEGVDPIPMHAMTRKMNLLAERMDELTFSLNPLVARMDHFLEGSEEDIAKMIANLEETSANVRDMTNDLKYRPWRLIRKG